MSKKITVPNMYDTYDFIDVGSKTDYKVVSKENGKMCGWISKKCIAKNRVKKGE